MGSSSFARGGYWALSNSFNHLLDYLKGRFELSLNRDYATVLLLQEHCVTVYGETIINEVSWLDRRARLHIDAETAGLSFGLRRLEEKTVPIDSAEGLRTLDAWHDKWASLVRGAAESWPGETVVEVSGGFDTRMVLAPVLSSETDLDRIMFYSSPALEEDYRIAALIAQEFGFRLNAASEPMAAHPLSPIEPYAKRAVTSLFFASRVREQFSQLPSSWQMIFTGSGGEMSRVYWQPYSCRVLVKHYQIILQNVHPQPRDDCFRQGIESIISRSFASIETVLRQTGEDVGKTGVDGQRYYMETGNRTHFGMQVARRTLFGQCIQTPLLDPLILKLRTPLDGSHPLLISALVYTRYHEGLATFPFDAGRSIPEETLRLARELNERYPRNAPVRSSARQIAPTWQVIDAPSPCLPDGASDADEMLMSDRLLEAYESPTVWHRFTEEFGSTPDKWRAPNPAKRQLNGDKYAAVSIAKALDDIKRGKDACKGYAAFVEVCRREVAALCNGAGLAPDAGDGWDANIRKRILLQAARSGLLSGAPGGARGALDGRPHPPKVSVVIPVYDSEPCIRR
ncbi:MAG: hypothetical protein IKG22_10515 [Atopobiaceae bacterium]|nr:hypothetical protein [Atopobiaceae bacterium]